MAREAGEAGGAPSAERELARFVQGVLGPALSTGDLKRDVHRAYYLLGVVGDTGTRQELKFLLEASGRMKVTAAERIDPEKPSSADKKAVEGLFREIVALNDMAAGVGSSVVNQPARLAEYQKEFTRLVGRLGVGADEITQGIATLFGSGDKEKFPPMPSAVGASLNVAPKADPAAPDPSAGVQDSTSNLKPSATTPTQGVEPNGDTPTTPDPASPTATPPAGPATPPVTTGAVSGGPGGGGNTGVAATSASATTGDGTPVQLPAASEAQLWRVDDTYLIAWRVPGTSTTLFYNVDTPQYLDAIYRGAIPKPHLEERPGTGDVATWLEEQGFGFFGGQVSEITSTSDHPWKGVADQWNKKSKIVPWLNDPDVQAWMAEGIIEGNPQALTPQVAREQGFEFAQGKGTAELTRELEIFGMTDAEIDRERSMIRSEVEDTFRTWGITVDDESRGAVEFAIDMRFRGEWSVNVLSNEARLFADPVTRERSALTEAVEEGASITSLRQDVASVRDEVEQWVGPGVARLLGDRWFESWAEQRRNDPNAQVKFEEALLGLRVAHFGEYGDAPGLRYDDIVSPYRYAAQTVWGQKMDETDPFFLSLVKGNDLGSAERKLREEGLKRGIKAVDQSAAQGLMQAFGTGVRRPTYV